MLRIDTTSECEVYTNAHGTKVELTEERGRGGSFYGLLITYAAGDPDARTGRDGGPGVFEMSFFAHPHASRWLAERGFAYVGVGPKPTDE